MTTPRRLAGHQVRVPQQRALYARTNADLTVNSPEGFPSDYPPVWWVGADQLNLNASWNHQGWNNPYGPPDATGLAVVNRATSLVVDPIAQSPLTCIEIGETTRVLPTPRWLTDPMLLRPDARHTVNVYSEVQQVGASKFWADLIRSALWWGIGAFIFEPDQQGMPTAGTLRLLNPHLVTTERVDGSLRWVVGATSASDPNRAVFSRDGYLSLGPVTYRIVVLRNPHSEISSEGTSQGVFEMSPSAFGIAGQVDSYTSGTFRSGVPAGYLSILTPNGTKEQADELRTSWLAHHGGDRRSIAVLSANVGFTPISMSPVDAAIGEVTRLSIASVAYAFSIDPNMLGAGLQNSASYNNVRDYFRQHKDFGIGIWISNFQDLLSALMPGAQVIRVDTDAFTKPEPKERYEAYEVALRAGILTIPEVRANEGLDPLPDAPDTVEHDRSLSAAETSQKVYLAVINGVLSVPEARQMIKDAGGAIEVDTIPELAAAPEPPVDERDHRVKPWRR